MTTPEPSSISALDELAAIRDYIADVQRQLQAGHMPDMGALERRTADLCRIIMESASDIQQKCAPELRDLAHQLDDCEKDMRDFFDSVVATGSKEK